MNDSQLVRALDRINIKALAKVDATGSSTAVDLKDYVGSIRIDLNAISLAGGTSPTLDLAVRTGALTTAMALVSGGAFTQVGNAASEQQKTFDLRELNRYVDVAYTLGGTTAAFDLHVVGHAIKQVL